MHKVTNLFKKIKPYFKNGYYMGAFIYVNIHTHADLKKLDIKYGYCVEEYTCDKIMSHTFEMMICVINDVCQSIFWPYFVITNMKYNIHIIKQLFNY